MTSAVSVALLSSLLLFLGLSTLARQRIRRARPNLGSTGLWLLGAAGILYTLLSREEHLAAPAVMIGALGYCFGYFTTPRGAPATVHREQIKIKSS